MFFDKKKEKAKPVKYKQELLDLKEKHTQTLIRLDKLEAKFLAQEEIKKTMREKEDRLTENIGELKELFKHLSSEKKEVDIKLGKLESSINQVRPLEIKKKLDGYDLKVEKVSGKIDLLSKKQGLLSAKLDDFSLKMKVFKGEDELLKMQTRVKEDLKIIEKTANLTNRHASKLENHYLKINQKVDLAVQAANDLAILKETLTLLKDELEERNLELSGVENNNFSESKFEDLTDNMLKNFLKVKEKLSELQRQIDSIKKGDVL